MSESILRTKSYEFAVKTVYLSRRLVDERREYILSKQLLRSGTSIAANIEEANQAESRRDFAHKLSIALKEATETNYWLRLLRDTETLRTEAADPMIRSCEELQRMLTASIRTIRGGAT